MKLGKLMYCRSELNQRGIEKYPRISDVIRTRRRNLMLIHEREGD